MPQEGISVDEFTKKYGNSLSVKDWESLYGMKQKPAEDLEAIRQAQAAKFPTDAERRQREFAQDQTAPPPQDPRYGMSAARYGMQPQVPAMANQTAERGFQNVASAFGMDDPKAVAISAARSLVPGLKPAQAIQERGIIGAPVEAIKTGLGINLAQSMGQNLGQASVGDLSDPSSPAWEGAQRGVAEAGQFAVMAAGAPKTARGIIEAAKPALKSANLAARLKSNAAANQAQVLQPTTKEMRGVTQKIAPALAEEGTPGIRSKKIDAHVMSKLDEATTEIKAAKAKVIDSPQVIDRTQLTGPVDEAISRLKVEGTDITGNPEALAELQKLRADLEKLPETMTTKQLIQYGDQLDERVDAHGGFKATGADQTKVRVTRGVSNVVRSVKNSLDPDFAAANKKYSLWRNAADVVEERQLGEVGKIGSGLPGRGGILDDILASWAGNAIGGPVGAAGVEAVNLLRQTRGWANVKTRFQMAAARAVEPPARGPLPESRQIGVGARQMPQPPSTSPMEVTTGTPLVRGYADLVPVGNKDIPRVPKSGTAKGMTLTNVIPDELTGAPKYYVYTEAGTGKQLKFTVPQK